MIASDSCSLLEVLGQRLHASFLCDLPFPRPVALVFGFAELQDGNDFADLGEDCADFGLTEIGAYMSALSASEALRTTHIVRQCLCVSRSSTFLHFTRPILVDRSNVEPQLLDPFPLLFSSIWRIILLSTVVVATI